ncbi:BTAD domain-containing putative transcriptional regulator [Kutzneria buriramensis]|uniref:DNA-binding SARP family transcriptional activator n=1 Tax=Kutzneria buriramensis TaxID=1045776 RepID=A0A3E0IB13_9PSEU|nr:DNA-binding SARP family transcriptional activator [Kutzneria buriramensis]
MVRFSLLGDVRADLDGHAVDVGPARQRCVLAVLLVDANYPVSIDQFAERVWSGALPHRVRGTLSSYVSRLRQALAGAPEVTIARHLGGYLLTVDQQAVDLYQFRTLVDQARSTENGEQALDLFEQALRLWRGEALSGLDSPWVTSMRATLLQERLTAEQDATDLRLRRGEHAELLGMLAAQAGEHPLDERLASQFMVALYRSGRQADALKHYERIRLRLSEDLGADPSPPLQHLHRQILTADHTLAAPVSEPRVQAVTPRQLPAPPGVFVGRDRELTALTKAVDQQTAQGATVVVSAIGGGGGVGKTWLALQWAYQNLDRFPDGQLFVDLLGYAPAGKPMEPGEAVCGFLDALDVQPAAIPAGLHAQTALYRSLVAGRRMLIVLDNARDTAQVEPLLPGSPACAVVVTSRDRLAGLVAAHNARPIALDTLDDAEARELLAGRLGPERLAAEPDAADELVDRCAGLPLALGVVAARAALRPDTLLAALAAELRDTATRLGALDTGDPAASVHAALSWSVAAIEPNQAQVFMLLGLAPGPDIALPAAESLTDLPAAEVSEALRALERVSLIQQHLPGRYRMHDLVRLHAAAHARQHLPLPDRDAALHRLVDYYLHTAHAADRLLAPHREPLQSGPPAASSRPHLLADKSTALAWFSAENPNLLATQRLVMREGWHRTVVHLAWTLTTFHSRQGRLHDYRTVWEAALATAARLDDHATTAMAHRYLGDAHARLGRPAEALDHLQQALAAAGDRGDTREQAHTHRVLAFVWEQQGDDQRALGHATHALNLYRPLGQPVREADALNQVGWHEARLGQYDQAHAHCQAALALCRRLHYREGVSNALDTLGYIAHHTGQHTQALGYYEQSLALCGQIGDTFNEADVLDRLGQAHAALDQHDQGRHAWHQALDLYRAQHRFAGADRVQRQLDALDHAPAPHGPN